MCQLLRAYEIIYINNVTILLLFMITIFWEKNLYLEIILLLVIYH